MGSASAGPGAVAMLGKRLPGCLTSPGVMGAPQKPIETGD